MIPGSSVTNAKRVSTPSTQLSKPLGEVTLAFLTRRDGADGRNQASSRGNENRARSIQLDVVEASHPSTTRGSSYHKRYTVPNVPSVRCRFSTRGLFQAASVAALVVVPLIARPVAAQTATGSLRGVIQDSNGGRLASAHVSVTSAAGVTRDTQADRRGEFHLSELAPGVYDVTVDAQG